MKLDILTPDFTVGAVEYASGAVARITCGIFAPPDRRLRIFGDLGVLSTDDTWNFASPVWLTRRTHLGLKAEKHPRLARWAGLGPRRVRPVRPARFEWAGRPANRIDFWRGIAELAAAHAENRPPRISGRWSLHVNELALALQDRSAAGAYRPIRSTFTPPEPMPWAH